MDRFVRKEQKKLRRGLTTGTCAAACTKAAMIRLFKGDVCREVSVRLPGGEVVKLPVQEADESDRLKWTNGNNGIDTGISDSEESEISKCKAANGIVVDLGKTKDEINESCCSKYPEVSARFFTVKDSGDDPDVTNGAEIHVCVSVVSGEDVPAKAFACDRDERLFLDGGKGVGIVTKEGLRQEVGQSAINPVPREMIFDAALSVLSELELEEHKEDVLITVIVPEGEKLGARTFNPRLGIEGGISILGTTGIVEPMSEAAIVSTIETEIRQKLLLDPDGRILVVPGNYGKRYAEGLGLDLKRAVEVSNYIGEAIDLAVSYGCRKFLLVGNIGKLVKLAAGIMNTYSKVADGRWEIFAAHLALSGGDREMVRRIKEAPTTEEMLRIIDEAGLREKVMDSIIREIEYHLDHRIRGQMEYGVVVFSERYGKIGETKGTSELMESFRNV